MSLRLLHNNRKQIPGNASGVLMGVFFASNYGNRLHANGMKVVVATDQVKTLNMHI